MKIAVVIVGAGACGLTAALAARDAGADVLVLERDASPSGSTALSSGFVPAAFTRFQAAVGVEDSPQRMFDDIQRKNGGQADARLVKAICAASGPAIEWLAVPVAEGEHERFLCRIELAGVERATFFPDAKAELDLARQSLEPSGSWQRLALELARREGAQPEPARAQGVVRLEKGAEVTYFRIDLRQAPQPLPRK